MDDRSNRIKLLKALAVTAELTGTELSEPAATVMADDLAAYPLPAVLVALTRCRRELKGRLTVAAIIERLDDGRPGPNEAWAMIPQDEAGSVVWTTEMAAAFGSAAPLLREDQIVAARSAFLEAYTAAVARARSEQEPVRWTPSMGHDPTTRAGAVQEAVRMGRISATHAEALLPGPDRGAIDSNIARLVGPASPMPAKVRAQLLAFIGKRRP